MTAPPGGPVPQWGDSWDLSADSGQPEVRREGPGRRRRWLPIVAAGLALGTVVAVYALGARGGNGSADRPYPLPSPTEPSLSVIPEAAPSQDSPSPELTAATHVSAPTTPTAAARTSRSTAPAPGTNAPPQFAPVSVEAEAVGNVLTGTAEVVSCAACAGGARVRYIDVSSSITVVATLSASGTRTIQVTYETDGPRQLKVRIGTAVVDVRSLDGGGWEVPNSFEFTADLPAGPVRLTFYNDTSPAPDVDRVVIR